MIHLINTSNPLEAHFTLTLAVPISDTQPQVTRNEPTVPHKSPKSNKHHNPLESQSCVGMNSHQQKRNKEKIGTKINQVMQEPDWKLLEVSCLDCDLSKRKSAALAISSTLSRSDSNC